MRHVAAYLMLVLGGNASPSDADVKKVLTSVGAEADDEKLAAFLKEMDGKSLDEVIAAGKAKLATVSVGGGGGGGGGAAAAATEEKKEEEKEKEESEDMGGGGMGMFGDDEGGGGDY